MAKTVEIVIKAKDQASGPLGRISGSLSRIGEIATGVLIGNAIPRLASGLLSLGGDALKSVADYERLQMSLESLVAKEIMHTTSVKDMTTAMAQAKPQAAGLLGWIQKLAIESPFSQEGVATAFRTVMAYGFASDEAQRLTSAIIDYTAASGASSEVMQRIGLALGQIKARGKLATQELNQLTEAGLDVRTILADAFGVSTAELTKMIEKGLVPADKAIEAITSSIENDFGGAAKRQSTTFAGLISTISDIKEVGLREFFTGTFQAAQPFIADIVDRLSSPEFMAALRTVGEEVGQRVAAGLQLVVERGPQFIAMALSMAESVRSTIGAALQWLAVNVIPLVQNAIQFVITNWAAFKGAVIAVGAILMGPVVAGALAAIGGLLLSLLSPIVLIIGAVALLGAAWATNWGGIRTTLTNVWNNNIKPALSNLWSWLSVMIPRALMMLRAFWENVLLPALRKVWNFINTYIIPVFKAIVKVWFAWMGLELRALQGLWQNVLLPALQKVWLFLNDSIIPIFKTVADTVSKVVSPVVNALAGAFTSVSNAIGGITGVANGVINTLNSLAGAINSVHLPSWLTPGSPTPFELGLRGIAAEMRQLSSAELPLFQARLGALGQGVNNYNLTVNTSAPAEPILADFNMMRSLAGA